MRIVMWIAMVFHFASFLIVQNVLLENVSRLVQELQTARRLDVEHLVSESVRPGELHLRPETAQLLPVLLQHSAELLGRELQVLALHDRDGDVGLLQRHDVVLGIVVILHCLALNLSKCFQ